MPVFIIPHCAPASIRSAILKPHSLAPPSHQTQQHHEKVDEVEVERKRAHHGLAARQSGVIAAVVHPLDPLGIVGREARKDADADDRNHPVQAARS